MKNRIKHPSDLVGTELDQAPAKNWREENWRINVYKCTRTDDHLLTTVDVHEGTAPFIVSCPKCKANAVSCLYPRMRPIPPEVPRITHELYSPDPDDITEERIFDSDTLDYIQNGGLLLRKLSGKYPPICHNENPLTEKQIYGNTSAEQLDKKEAALQAKAEEIRKKNGGGF